MNVKIFLEIISHECLAGYTYCRELLPCQSISIEIKLFRIFLRVLDSRTSTSINIAAYIPPYPSHCPCCLSQLREHDTDDEKAVELEAALKIKCGTFFGRGKTLFGLATCYLLDAA